MSPELKEFILNNQDLINENTKNSWGQIYDKLLFDMKGEFTETILDSGVNDPAMIMGYIPTGYLHNSDIVNYKIPDNVETIGRLAFHWCSRLTNIVIPDSVTNISEYAFCNCHSLTSIKIPSTVVSIGRCAFFSCDSLTSVIIPNSVTSIDGEVFRNCSKLKSVVIDNSVTNIPSDTFVGCISLIEIKFNGTQKEAMKCGFDYILKMNWRTCPSLKKLICTDGVIEV